jgi:hypothetical protein
MIDMIKQTTANPYSILTKKHIGDKLFVLKLYT